MERPIEYVRGEVEFFYRNFSVDERVLIPRMETEDLVRLALVHIRQSGVPVQVVDTGTGSGIIPVSLAAELPRSVCRTIAFDISPGALEVARANAERNGVELEAFQSDLLARLLDGAVRLNPSVPVVCTANLPYIRTDDPAVGDDVRVHEPHLALYGGDSTGFELYESYFRQLLRLRAMIDAPIAAFSEIGFDQGDIALAFLSPFQIDAKVHSDSFGNPRIVSFIL